MQTIKTKTLIFFSILFFVSCKDSKWETIKGNGIDNEPKSIEQAIYFENNMTGVVGGYYLVKNENSKNADKLEIIPTLYLTEDAGENWKQIIFDKNLRGSINNAYIGADTIVCLLDRSIILFSINKGQTFTETQDKKEFETYWNKYLNYNRYEIRNDNFEFDNIKYTIKETYKNNHATLIVCYVPESLTDYYFVSFDNGKNWKYLQSDYGSNRNKYLLEDKYLLAYQYPFGLKKLKLK